MRQLRIFGMVALCAFALACAKQEEGSTDSTSVAAASDTTVTTSTSIDTASATTTGASGGTVSAMTPDEKEFVVTAAQDSMAEVNGGNTAQQKAANAAVKTYGARMVTDHTRANDELKALATTKGLALPTDVKEEHKKAAEHLATLEGAAFDKAYMDHMVMDHEKAVALFEKMSQNAADADLKAWATKTLPTLQDHLRQAKEIKGKLK